MSTPLASPRSSGITIAAALQTARSRLEGLSETARLDAEILLARALNRDRSYLRAWPERKLSPDVEDRFHHLIERRQSGTPVAYLFGEKEFWSRTFRVSPDVLIPRPETELLVELALLTLPASETADVLDRGTGSGCATSPPCAGCATGSTASTRSRSTWRRSPLVRTCRQAT